MAQLSSGDRAPDFVLKDQNGNEVALKNLRGKKVLLYFYPRADTPGCTRQSCSVRDAKAELADAGVAVLGISPDQPAKQAKFDTKHSLGFPLLSDPDHEVAEAYGVWGDKPMYGKLLKGIIRSSFLIDEQGVIIDAWYKVSPEKTVPNAENALMAHKEG